MTLLYGLGNNETKYLKTKHNAGRIVLELLAQKMDLVLQKKNGFWFAKYHRGDHDLLLVYSDGYMNTSGQPLADFCSYFKLKPDRLLVLQDDSDQMVNSQKLSIGGGTAGHNGIISVYQYCESFGIKRDNVLRLKIGIRPEGNRLKSETFVLSSISQTEQSHYQKIADELYKNLSLIESDSIPILQNIFNSDLAN